MSGEENLFPMKKTVLLASLFFAGVSVAVNSAAAQTVNPVLQWNRTLLTIVRTPGAQPATVHATRSYAILHAAIFDAVNSIDRTISLSWFSFPEYRARLHRMQRPTPLPTKFL